MKGVFTDASLVKKVMKLNCMLIEFYHLLIS